MFKLQLKAYDSLLIGGEIKIPDVFTMMQQPMFVNADFTEVYQNCRSEYIRKLLDNVPLKGGYKYTKVTSITQFLSPTTSSIENKAWHLDPGTPAPFKHDMRLHIFCSGFDLTSTTKFLTNEVEVELPDELYDARHRVFREYITDHADEYGFVPKAIPANHFVTFTNMHPHVALPPTKYEMRYFMRVQESDIEAPQLWEDALRIQTTVLVRDGLTLPSLIKYHDGILLKTKLEV